MADGQVVFEISGDPKNINATVKEVTGNIQQESKKWDQAVNQSTGNMEASFASMVKNIAAGITAAKIGKAILDWGKNAISAASDLAEVQNVVDVTFGDGAKQIESWAKTAGTQFGLTETQAKKFTSTLGAMMKSSGVAGDEIVSMSTDLAGLAADMASFYNLDFETAFQKIRSGISGETEPLKQLGVNMSVANLEAFALEQGITKSFNAMSQGEQVMLRYQYLMQATADAQGDFSRTSDSFANATRRVEAAMDTINTKGGQLLLSVIEPLTSGLADFLTQITTPPESTIFDDFNEIDLDTAGKMNDLEQTYNKAQDIINLLKEISEQTLTLKDGSTVTFEELFKDIGNVEKNGGDVRGYLEGLGVDVDLVIQKYQVWKESTRQLTSLVPSLTAAIDSETGAINGGTGALQKNLDEWKAYQEKKIAWAAYYAKEQALAERKASLFMYEFDEGSARQAVIRQKATLDRLREELGVGNENYDLIIKLNATGGQAPLTEAEKQWNDAVRTLGELQKAAADAGSELTQQTVDYSAAEQQLADGKAALIEKYGEEEDAANDAGDAVEDYGGKSTEAWQKATTGAQEAIKALSDYVKGVHDATEQTVNSIIKGFDKVTKSGDESRQKSSEYAAQEIELIQQYQSELSKYLNADGSVNLKKMSDDYDNLTKAEQEAYNKLADLHNKQKEVNESLNAYKPETMAQNLQTQIDFMSEYVDNLAKAREMGLSDELLASLSDGTAESAEYLAGLVKDAEGAAKVDELFQKVQEAKKGFTDALTQQKLTVDETYQAMVDKAKEAIGEMSLGGEAEAAMGETVSGLASGISSHVSEVSAAVDSIISELERLNGFGVSINLGAFGSIDFTIPFGLDGSHALGLDYVPFNGYLAELHEGEGILTAEENRIWQRFKNGGSASQNVDYDALGGVMRDNVKPGGDVFLDGRTVGKVISDIQGQSYRSLKKSGWQS